MFRLFDPRPSPALLAMALPIAVQELTMTAWLIIKGFSKGGSERESDSV